MNISKFMPFENVSSDMYISKNRVVFCVCYLCFQTLTNRAMVLLAQVTFKITK
jgi:hypothetical protein